MVKLGMSFLFVIILTIFCKFLPELTLWGFWAVCIILVVFSNLWDFLKFLTSIFGIFRAEP